MKDSPEPLQIDIVSDVVCPWCVIGYRQLAQALEETGTAHEIRWHPFELNHDMPAEGQNLAEHIAQKYGSTPEQSAQARERITELGREVGFDFRYDAAMRMYNTFDAHQLLHWADAQGRKHALEMALFRAYFTEHADLSDREVLTGIAGGAGLDPAEARAVLEDQRHAEEVREAESFWIGQGIRGVPAVIFNRRHLVSGAQGVENYTRILEQLAAMDA